MNSAPRDERAVLAAGVRTIEPVLQPEGFVVEPPDGGFASAGPYAAAKCRRGDLEIGLIVRHGDRLGSPNYSYDQRKAPHTDLMWALGKQGSGRLVRKDYMWFVDNQGGDAFEALAADLRDFVIPALRSSESDFREAVFRAHQKAFSEVLGTRNVPGTLSKK